MMKRAHTILVWLFLFLLPTQLGKHFFMDFSYVNGVRIDYLALAVYLTDILFGLLLLFHAQRLLVLAKKHQRRLLIISGLLLVSIGLSQHPLLAAYTVLKFVEIVFAYVLFSQTTINQRVFLSAFAAGAGLQVLLTLLQFSSKGSVQGIFYYLGERFLSISTPGIAKAHLLGEQILRPYGTFSHPNSMGGFYVLLYAFILSVSPSSKKNSTLKFILLMLSTILILISFSKTAILTFALVTVVNLFWRHRSLFQCTFCMFAKTFMGLTVLALFLSSRGDIFSLDKRLFLFKQAWEIILTHPLLGTGFGHHLFAHAAYSSPYPYFFLQPVHNIWVLFVMEAGPPIAVLLALWTFKPTQKALRKHRNYLVLPMLVVVITGSVDHYWITLQQNMLLLGVVGGLLTKHARDPKPIFHKSGRQ